MSNRCLRPLAALVAIVSLGVPARSQLTDRIPIVKGEIRTVTPLPLHEYRVELGDLDRRKDSFRADIQLDGSFQLRDVRSGTYTLRVTTLHGDVLYQELVTVIPQSGLLTVHLPPSNKQPAGAGTVSVTQLRHPPARKALQALVSAQRFSEAGQTGKAAQELEKAIRISPEFADAYNNLAVQHLRMGRIEEAAAEFTRAIAIAGPSPLQLSNLAYTQALLNRFPEATANARAALRMDAVCPQAHLILGSILALDPATRAEAIPHLERAAETLASARVTLDKLRRMR